MLLAPADTRTLHVVFERAPGGYRVVVVDASGAEAAAPFRPPAAEPELDSVLREPDAADGRSDRARRAGVRLFETVFTGPALERLRGTQETAAQHAGCVRLCLQLGAVPELEAVPWECLCDPATGELLAMDAGSLVRYLPAPGAPGATAAGPLRVLAVLAGGAGMDPEREWHALHESVSMLVDEGAVGLERLEEPSEAGLTRRLSRGLVHVVHFVGMGQCQQRAQRATLLLQGQSGQPRDVTVQRLGTLLQQHTALKLAVLDVRPAAPAGRCDPFNVAARLLVQQGVGASAVLGARRLGGIRQTGARALYEVLAAGGAVDEGIAAARRRLRAEAGDAHAIAPALYARWPEIRAVVSAGAASAAAAQPAVAAHAAEPLRHADGSGSAAPPRSPVVQPPPPPSLRERHARTVELKRQREEFDVFLCHKGSDKPLVKRVGERLLERGILPWLDEWELRPGLAWAQLLEQQIGRIRTAAVFVGPDGIGPWQRQEIDAFLREFVDRQAPVIPVLLENAPRQPELPLFLKGLTWVDFRVLDPDPLERLIWGITGTRWPRSL